VLTMISYKITNIYHISVTRVFETEYIINYIFA
jgi:hypothetical protein